MSGASVQAQGRMDNWFSLLPNVMMGVSGFGERCYVS
jgi:hypothetical protein